MSYSSPYGFSIPNMVSPYTYRVGFATYSVIAATAPASYTWESASRAVYYPIVLPGPCTVRRVWWANGATTTGGATIEVGVYTNDGYAPAVKLVSGSATQGTASEVQFVDVTDTALPAGRFWIAVTASATTNTTMFKSNTTPSSAIDAAFRCEQSSASPLPATATPVETNGSGIWVCGFATTATP